VTSKARRVTFLLAGLLLVGGVVGLIAFAAMPKPRLIPINDLARLMKDGQIASVVVSGNDGTATTRQQKTFGFRMDQPGSLPQLLESFGVTSEQLSQVSYSISSPSQLGAFVTAAGALLPVVLLGGVAVLVLRRRPTVATCSVSVRQMPAYWMGTGRALPSRTSLA
jgi:hypothetical protein